MVTESLGGLTPPCMLITTLLNNSCSDFTGGKMYEIHIKLSVLEAGESLLSKNGTELLTGFPDLAESEPWGSLPKVLYD